MRWDRNIDGALVLLDDEGANIGHVWAYGNGFKAVTVRRGNGLIERELLGSFGGSQAAKRAVERGVTNA